MLQGNKSLARTTITLHPKTVSERKASTKSTQGVPFIRGQFVHYRKKEEAIQIKDQLCKEILPIIIFKTVKNNVHAPGM